MGKGILRTSGATTSSPVSLTLLPPASSATVGVAYNSQLTAFGGSAPYTAYGFALGNLTGSGLTLNTTTGAITGTPTTSGTITFTGKVTDSASNTATAICTIVVAASSSGNPLAPNITSSTAAASYGLLGNVSVFGFSGTITLPTSDPNYSHLASIVILAFAPGSTDGQLIATILSSSFGASTVTFSGGQIAQPNSAQTWTLQFTVYNEYGSPTTSAYTKTVSVQASVVTSISSASENTANRTVDAVTRQVHVHPSFIPVLGSGQVPQNVTYWKSKDGGSTYYGVAWAMVSSVGQSISWDDIAPSATQTWAVAAVIGAVQVDPYNAIPAASLPAGAVTKTFSVAGLSTPAANLITSITVASGSGGSFPYNVEPNADGLQSYFCIPSVTYDDSAARLDPNAWVVGVTAQDYDAAGNPIGPEQAWDGHQVSVAGSSSTQVLTGPNNQGILGQYGTSGYGYSRTDPYPGGSPANLASVRLRVYVQSRLDQTNGAVFNPAASVLQTSVGSGAGYVTVTVAAGGAIPAGAISAPRVTGSFGTTVTMPGSQINGTLNSTVSVAASQVSGTFTTGVNMPGSQITGTLNSAVTVTASSVSGTFTTGVNMPGSQITGTLNSAVTVNATSVSGTFTSGVSMPGSQITGTLNSAVVVTASSITGTFTSGVTLPGSQITGSLNSSVAVNANSLTGIVNAGVSVPGSTITGSISSSVSISGTSITGALNSGVTLNVSQVTGALSSSSTLNAANLAGTLNSGVSVSVSQVSGALSASSTLNAANLSGTLNSGVSVPGSTITGSISSSVSVSGSSLTGTINTGVSVPGSTITGSISSSVTISGSSITGVLNGAASIAGSQITGVIITQANLATAVQAAVLGIGLIYDPTSSTLTQSTSGANLLSNPNFQYGFNQWYTSVCTLDTSTYYITSPSVKFVGSPTAEMDSIKYPCKPGDIFTAKAWVLSTSGATAAMTAFIRFWTSGGSYITQTNAVATAVTVWSQLIVQQVTAPSNAAFVDIGFYDNTSGGTWWVDNVELNRVADSTLISSVSAGVINGVIAVGGSCTIQAGTLTGSLSASTLAATNIGSFSGSLSSGQVGTINIGSLSGTITSAQLGSVAINGANITNLSISSGKIASVNISSLQAGTVNFTSTTVLQNGSSGPSVSIASSGIVCGSGTNAVAVTPSGVSILGPNGTLTATSSGVSISSGSSSITISATSVAIVNGTLATTSGTKTLNVDTSNWFRAYDSSTGVSFMTPLMVSTTYVSTQNLSMSGDPGFTGTLAAAISSGRNVVNGVIHS